MLRMCITICGRTSRYRNRTLPRLIWGVAFLFVMTTAAAAQSPSGSVAFETAEGSTAGDTLWTGCTLLFKGKLYTCTLRGLSAPAAGLARVSGTVFDLKEVGAFAGTYKVVEDNFLLGGGHVTVQNQNGVRMVLAAFALLTELQVPPQGMEIKLK